MSACTRNHLLYEDAEFGPVPTSIEGERQKKMKCRCSPAQELKLYFVQQGKNKGKPYYNCPNRKCNSFRW